MFDHKIEIVRKDGTERNVYGDLVGDEQHVATCWAERTENGGRENMYASRIVASNEVVYTIRHRSGITAAMWVKEGDELLSIVSIYEEGRKYRLHIKTRRDDAQS